MKRNFTFTVKAPTFKALEDLEEGFSYSLGSKKEYCCKKRLQHILQVLFCKLMSRKPSASARPRAILPSNGHLAAPRAFVEFHPSMSLENVPTLADCLAVSSAAAPTYSAQIQSLGMSNVEDATLDSVLADRLHLWTKVAEMIGKLGPAEPYQGDVLALQKLLQLHFLCKQRETHLHTLQLTLLQEGRRSTTTTAETQNDTDAVDDVLNVNEVKWSEERQRSFDIADYDAMDLIELSEQFS